MSNTSAKLALALFVVLIPAAAGFAQHAGSVSTRHVPNPAPGSRAAAKCFQVSPEHVRAELAHPDAVCWAPRSITDDAGV
jgi:hypothetical protein